MGQIPERNKGNLESMTVKKWEAQEVLPVPIKTRAPRLA